MSNSTLPALCAADDSPDYAQTRTTTRSRIQSHNQVYATENVPRFDLRDVPRYCAHLVVDLNHQNNNSVDARISGNCIKMSGKKTEPHCHKISVTGSLTRLHAMALLHQLYNEMARFGVISVASEWDLLGELMYEYRVPAWLRERGHTTLLPPFLAQWRAAPAEAPPMSVLEVWRRRKSTMASSNAWKAMDAFVHRHTLESSPNRVMSTAFNVRMNRRLLLCHFGMRARKPKLFPAVIIQPERTRVRISVFENGSMLILRGRSMDECVAFLRNIRPKLLKSTETRYNELFGTNATVTRLLTAPDS